MFFLSYIAFFLGSFSPRWAVIKNFTLFRFYDTEKLFMTTSYQWGNIFALLFISALLVGLATYLFHRKDVAR